MARTDSPMDESSLSSMSSSEDEFPDEATEVLDDGPPAKRLKTAGRSNTPSAAAQDHEAPPDLLDGMSDVSSDTDGDVPSSPVNARQDEDDFQEQITVCAWEGCRTGDMGNMDKLVEHIHNDHIESRQKKYTCEWVGCSRKSMPHASGYALKAHMRSHTREKPFYCYLPECDRAFTRSDALAKHMRTVHETEALRPSDPVPKSMQAAAGAGKTKNLKIIIKTPQSHSASGHDDGGDDASAGDDSSGDMFTPLTADQGFSADELGMQLSRLTSLCRLQVRWAEEEGERLRAECRQWEELYKREWLEKEVLLDQVVRSEQAWHERRQAVLSGAVDVVVADAAEVEANDDTEDPMAVEA
ncbi:hypothetical protein C8A05DRAFT_12412 [Staphylotrichum tortipilum]|uniref:C2H2-type domain-containing protein n=1 Tax=Staphylotrichum tortipilum TaxID=2831512 RepID=A0AAN6MRZ0_9PEZI|nr:hypothetical protein C8A05DRAFT_12412 [Staphylotrichum longicolle]